MEFVCFNGRGKLVLKCPSSHIPLQVSTILLRSPSLGQRDRDKSRKTPPPPYSYQEDLNDGVGVRDYSHGVKSLRDHSRQ